MVRSPGSYPSSTLTLLPDERQRPSEDVHEVWQPVGVRRAVELPDVHHIVLILQYGSWKENILQDASETEGKDLQNRGQTSSVVLRRALDNNERTRSTTEVVRPCDEEATYEIGGKRQMQL